MGNFLLGLLIAIAVLIVIAGVAIGWIAFRVSQEQISPLAVLNPDGRTGRALVVEHRGLSDFPDKVMTAFASGLVEAGWRCERTTASRETPADLTGYDMVVLGSPVYAGKPAKPLQDYISRLPSLEGVGVVIVLTGAGDTEAALQFTEELVRAKNGTTIGRFGYTTMKPNESPPIGVESNLEKGIAMARNAGRGMSPAAP